MSAVRQRIAARLRCYITRRSCAPELPRLLSYASTPVRCRCLARWQTALRRLRGHDEWPSSTRHRTRSSAAYRWDGSRAESRCRLTAAARRSRIPGPIRSRRSTRRPAQPVRTLAAGFEPMGVVRWIRPPRSLYVANRLGNDISDRRLEDRSRGLPAAGGPRRELTSLSRPTARAFTPRTCIPTSASSARRQCPRSPRWIPRHQIIADRERLQNVRRSFSHRDFR